MIQKNQSILKKKKNLNYLNCGNILVKIEFLCFFSYFKIQETFDNWAKLILLIHANE